MLNRGQFILILTAISTMAALALGFFAIDKLTMENLYRQGTFYFLALNLLLWSQLILQKVLDNREAVMHWLNEHRWALLSALLIVIAIAVAIPAEYRILADETNLLGTAMAMHDHRQCYNPTMVMNYFHGMQRTIESLVDMRPCFYPFLVAIAHSLLGYDTVNGFRVNLFAGFFILLLFYQMVQQRFGTRTGALAMLLLASFPLLVMYMRSCGFETVNLLWVLLLIYLCDRFHRDGTAANAELVSLTLPLLAQTRYESVLSVFCVVPLLFMRMSRKEFSRLTWRTPLIPLLFLPVAWLRVITFNNKAFQVDSVEQAFGFDLLLKNFQASFSFFLGEKSEYGMVALLGLLAAAGLLLWLYDYLRLRLADRDLAMPLLVAGLTAVHALARFSYFWGDLRLQYTSRLGIVFLPLLAWLSAYLLFRLHRSWQLRFHWLYLGAFALILHGWPVAANNLAVREIFYFREFKSIKQLLEKEFPDKAGYFLITDLANLYTPFRYSAVYTHYAQANRHDVMAQLQRRTYRQALVIQKISLGNHKPVAGSFLDESFKLEKLHEIQLHAGEYIRVSRLLSDPVCEENQ